MSDEPELAKSGQDLNICIALTCRISGTKTLRVLTLHVKYIGDEFALGTVKVYATRSLVDTFSEYDRFGGCGPHENVYRF